MADLDEIYEKYGDRKVKKGGERRRQAMRSYAAMVQDRQREEDRKSKLRQGGVVEVTCSWCGEEEIPEFRDGDLAACKKCMGKALFGALGDPKHKSKLPPEIVAKQAPKEEEADNLWDEDPEEANEPLATKAV